MINYNHIKYEKKCVIKKRKKANNNISFIMNTRKKEIVMASCLGIYLSNNIIKYAKLTSDNNNNIKVENFGVRFIKDNQKDTLKNIIEETNSTKIPIVMNPQNDKFINYQMFEQVQSSGIARDVARMEFEAWCEKNAKSPDKYSFVYKNADVKNEENKFNSVLNFVEKKNIEDYQAIDKYEITDIYPAQLLMYRLVPKSEENYMLVNLDNELSISVVIDGKLADIKFYNIGMKKILDDFSVKLGSYQKAYEACKQLNVYSDEDTNNDRLLESIAEPVLQDVLRDIAALSTRYKARLEKIFLTGSGIVFTNIDILIREYLSIKCEILKPDFLKNTADVRNIAEALETMPAMSMAYELLKQNDKGIGYSTSKTKIKKEFGKIFSGGKDIKSSILNIFKVNDNKTEKNTTEDKHHGIEIIEDKSFTIVTCALIVAGLTLVSYVIFSNVYISTVNKTLQTISKKKTETLESLSLAKSDISYISNNTSQYKEINDNVEDVVEQIENNKIGKFTTYNVASFLQNIIRIIPKNVKLNTISSDDNKNIKITAQSNSYADLGYFVAELKINSTLNNVKINYVKNGETTVIEIGGELP